MRCHKTLTSYCMWYKTVHKWLRGWWFLGICHFIYLLILFLLLFFGLNMWLRISSWAWLSEEHSKFFCGLQLLNLHALETLRWIIYMGLSYLSPLIGCEAVKNFLLTCTWLCAAMHRVFTEAQFKHLIHAILSLCLRAGVIKVDR